MNNLIKKNKNIISENRFHILNGCEFLLNDKTAEEFALYMKQFNDLYEYLACIVEKYSSSVHPNIIDLGVGPGLLSVEIFRKKPQATIIGIDPLIKMLQLAKENFTNVHIKTFEPIIGISENIPLKNNSMDIIVSRFSLPYWTKPNLSFKEMFRVLKPGGKVILEELNHEFPTWKLMIIKIGMLFKQAGRDVTKYHIDAYKLAYTVEQLEKFFIDTGFTIMEKEGKKKQWRFIIIAEKK